MTRFVVFLAVFFLEFLAGSAPLAVAQTTPAAHLPNPFEDRCQRVENRLIRLSEKLVLDPNRTSQAELLLALLNPDQEHSVI